MKIKRVSLQNPAILVIPQWFKGQAHDYSTFIDPTKDLPGLGIEKNGEEVSITCDGVLVAGIPMANVRGYSYDVQEVLPEATQPEASDAAPPETPKRQRRV